jgi:hypothetical protein
VDDCPAIRVIDKRLDKPRADASPAIFRPDDDVGQIRENRAVGDCPAEADLVAVEIGPQRKASWQRRGDGSRRSARCPSSFAINRSEVARKSIRETSKLISQSEIARSIRHP